MMNSVRPKTLIGCIKRSKYHDIAIEMVRSGMSSSEVMDGMNAIQTAVHCGAEKVLREMIGAKVPWNKTGCLYIAIERYLKIIRSKMDHLDDRVVAKKVIQLLVNAGATLSPSDMFRAIDTLDSRFIEMVIEHGAPIDSDASPFVSGGNALHHAARIRMQHNSAAVKSAIQTLVEWGCDMRHLNADGETPYEMVEKESFFRDVFEGMGYVPRGKNKAA